MTYREVMEKVVNLVKDGIDVEVDIAIHGLALSVYPKHAWYDGSLLKAISRMDAPFEMHLTDVSPDASAKSEPCEEGTCYTFEKDDMTVQVIFFGE